MNSYGLYKAGKLEKCYGPNCDGNEGPHPEDIVDNVYPCNGLFMMETATCTDFQISIALALS